MPNRLLALVALVRMRGVSKNHLTKLNSFADEMRGLGNKRNRVVHDPWIGDESTGAPHRFQISADRTLVLGYVPMSTDDVLEIVGLIADAVERFDTIIRAIIAEIEPPSPEKCA